MLATTDYFENETEWDWWAQMIANDAIITSGGLRHTKYITAQAMGNGMTDLLEMLMQQYLIVIPRVLKHSLVRIIQHR